MLGPLARAISVDGLGGTGRKAGGDSQQRQPFWKPEREKVRNGAGRGEGEGRQGQCSEALCRPVTAPEVARRRRPVWTPGSTPARRASHLPTQEIAAASAENSRCPAPWRRDGSALLSYIRPSPRSPDSTSLCPHSSLRGDSGCFSVGEDTGDGLWSHRVRAPLCTRLSKSTEHSSPSVSRQNLAAATVISM